MGIVAGQAVFPAGGVPGLLADRAVPAADRNLFGQGGRRQQIRVGVVRPPLVDHSIHAAPVVANQEPSLQPPLDLRMRLVRGQLEGLHHDRAGGKGPFAIRLEADLRALRDRHVPRLDCAVGPEGHDEIVGDEPRAGDQVGSIGEGPRLGQQRRQRTVDIRRHVQIGPGREPGGNAGDGRRGGSIGLAHLGGGREGTQRQFQQCELQFHHHS